MSSIDALLALPKYGSGIGLHRMAALSADVLAGDWALSLDAVKVTGSNGKGSVSAMVAAILGALGIATGLYTSPHLYRFNERIAVAGEPISDIDLDRSIAWFEGAKEAYRRDHPEDAIGAFEAFTAVALHHFDAVRPRALVAEAGIGGRYDSTRIIPGRVVGLTSIDLEHTAALGGTRELIAYDKADLCPAGGVLVTGTLETDLLRRLRAYADLREIELISAPEQTRAGEPRFAANHMIVDLAIGDLRLPDLVIALRGHHQIGNAAVAILLALRWIERNAADLPSSAIERAIRAGLGAVSWPGRFETISNDPEVIVDVGHSPDAITWLLRTARAALAGRRVLLVTGASHDKAVEAIVAELVTIADAVIATRAHHRGAPVDRVVKVVRESAPRVPCRSAPAIEEAMESAIAEARRDGATVLVAGGLFLAIEAAEAARGRDPRALRFF